MTEQTNDVKAYFGLNEENQKLVNQLQAVTDKNKEKSQQKVQELTTDSNVDFDLDRKKDGTVKNTKYNYQAILTYDKNLKGLLKYNVDTQEMEITEDRDLPQPAPLKPIHLKKGFIGDTAIQNINNYIATKADYKLDIPMQSFMQALTTVTDSQQWDPLKEWLDGLQWDGKDRIGTVLQTFLGAEPTEANKFGFKLWLMGAIGKIKNKQCKFDYVLDLVGGQGVGKTEFLKRIAPLGMYTDQFNSFTNKDDLSIMRKCLIVNDDEMAASDHASFEEIKKFVTDTEFEFRKPYGRASTHFYKSFVLARTSNHIEHLADKTGDRRFISIECEANNKDPKKSVFDDLSDDYINQMWAQAKQAFEQSKNPFKLTKEQRELLEQGREQFIKNNPVEQITLDLLENEFSNTNFIFNSQLRLLLQIKLGKNSLNKKDFNSATNILVNNGWRSGRKRRTLPDGRPTTERGYKRVNPIEIDKDKDSVNEWINNASRAGAIERGKVATGGAKYSDIVKAKIANDDENNDDHDWEEYLNQHKNGDNSFAVDNQAIDQNNDKKGNN